MDNPTIIKLFETQERSFNKRMDTMEENLKEFSQASMSLNRAKLMNELDEVKHVQDKILDAQERMVDENKIRNGRIEKTEECNKEIKEETRFARWVQKHPLPAAIALLIVVMIGAFAYHNVNFKKTVENKTGVVMEAPAEQ